MEPKVSIIILNWNGLEDTRECLKSLLEIDYSNYNIILVDNGSSDGSIEYLKKLKGNIQCIFHEKNLGCDLAYNLAIKNALKQKSEYIMILSNDTIVDKNVIKILIRYMEKEGCVGVASPFIYNYYDKKKLNKSNIPGRFNLKKGGGEPWERNLNKLKMCKKPFFTDYTSGCCWMIKREVIEKTGVFNEKYFTYCEELDWALRIQKRGFKFANIPLAKIWHKGAKATNKVTGFKNYYMARNMIWLERTYASEKEFLIFLLRLFFIKYIKTIFLSMSQKNRGLLLKKYFKGIKDGFFSTKSTFMKKEFYSIN